MAKVTHKCARLCGRGIGRAKGGRRYWCGTRTHTKIRNICERGGIHIPCMRMSQTVCTWVAVGLREGIHKIDNNICDGIV